jgi:hypothetical protein
MGVVLSFTERRRTLAPPPAARTVTPPNPAHKRVLEQLVYLSVRNPTLFRAYSGVIEDGAIELGWTPRRSGGAA